MYIGKSVNIEVRFKQHKYINTNMPIDKAIRKYGKDNFTFEIIEECSRDKLNEREKYWISYYNTCYGVGYNCTTGGDGASHPVKLSHNSVDKIISLLQNNDLSIDEIAHLFHVSTKTICDINNGKSRVRNSITYPIRRYQMNDDTNSRKFIISKDELLHQMEATQGNFDLIGEKYSISGVTIRNLCKEYNIPYHRCDYGFQQIYYNSDHIIQYDTNNNYIADYNSVREAGRQNNINPKAIYRALHTNSHFSHNYKWYLCD